MMGIMSTEHSNEKTGTFISFLTETLSVKYLSWNILIKTTTLDFYIYSV